MASKKLIERTISAFDNDDDFGRMCTLHSVGALNRAEFIESLGLQSDERLELLIEDITDG